MPNDYHFDPIKFHLPFYRMMNPVMVNGKQIFDNLILKEEDEIDMNMDYEDGGDDDNNPIINTCTLYTI